MAMGFGGLAGRIRDVGQKADTRLGSLAQRIDYGWRKLDAWLNRPLPPPGGWLRAALAPQGYPWFVPVLMVVLITGLAIGPTLQLWTRDKLILLLVGLAGLAAHNLLAWRCERVRSWLAAGQILWLAILSAIIWIRAGAGARFAEGGLYRHVGLLVAAMLAVGLPFNWWLAKRLFRWGGSRLHDALPQVELFQPRGRYDFRARGLIATLVIVPVRYPVALLLPGSLCALGHPGGGALLWWFLVPNLVAAFFLVIGVLFERIMAMLRTVGRLFFIGPQLVLSIAIVVVALLRLARVHYVNYVFDTGGVPNWTILAYVTLAYAVAWYYAFWSDQFAARRLIARLGGVRHGEATPDDIPYRYDGPELTKVEREGRRIALHGAGRLMVRGRSSTEPDQPRFNFHTLQSLLETFQRRLEGAGETRSDEDPLPLTRDLLRGSRVYPVLTSLVAFGIIGGTVLLSLFRTTQPAELEIHGSTSAAFNLESRLLGIDGKTACGDDSGRPRIAVAASGGGTRAALYTASLLQGLAATDRLCDLVLASGVSGGSGALAYLTARQSTLMKRGLVEADWKAFGDAMAEPYIQRVLDGVTELRVAFALQEPRAVCGEPGAGDEDKGLTHEPWPSRTRIGQLLAESFVCRFGPMPIEKAPYGLIFNTSLAGTLVPAGASAVDGETAAGSARRRSEAATDAAAGGRLALTNLPARTIATQPDKVRGMEFVALDVAGIDVGRAAALSANFPPVFPNAAIDVYGQPRDAATAHRYWVTDGGAVENRATVTLLRALLWTADRFCRPEGIGGGCTLPQKIPDLHIIVADASAAGGAYEESLGLGSALTAGAQLGLQLEHDLVHALREVYGRLGARVCFHDLPMPTVLRRGGIGTHWMLPGKMTFDRPPSVEPAAQEDDEVTVPASEVERVVLDLHLAATEAGYTAGMKTLSRWITADREAPHRAGWEQIQRDLKDPKACGDP